MNNLVVLDLYANGVVSYNVYSYSYGNLASTVRVIPPSIPIYLNFTYPTNNVLLPSPNLYAWDVLATVTDTTYSYYQ